MNKTLLLLFLSIAVVLPAFSQRVLKDIAQGTGNAYVFQQGAFSSGDTLFFRANPNRDEKYYFYLTNGTSISTKRMPGDYYQFGYVSNPLTVNQFKFKGKLFVFFENGLYLVKNDSLKIVKYLPSHRYAYFFLNSFELNNQIHFLVYNEEDKNFDFYKTDGTDNGTILYKSIQSETPVMYWGDGFVLNGKYFQSFNNGTTIVMSTDGTEANTTSIKNHKLGLGGNTVVGSNTYFSVADNVGPLYKPKLWKSKGDSLSTQKVLAQVNGDSAYAIYNLFKFKDDLYFSVYANNELRFSRFDTNSKAITSISSVIHHEIPALITNQKIYYSNVSYDVISFYENTGSLASEKLIFCLPYKSSTAYTLYVGTNNYYVSEQLIQNGGLYDDVVYWVYNGSGVKKITDLIPTLNLGIFYNIIGVVGDTFYFSASDSQHGYELWRTDGTTAGTYMLKDINKEIASSNPKILFSMKDYLYFMADDITHGQELWRTNGTTTSLHADLNQNGSLRHVPSSHYVSHAKFKSSYILNLAYNQFQVASDGNINYFNFLPVNPNSNLYELNDSLYFMGSDNNLWKSNGTAIGTKKAIHLDSTNNGTENIGSQILGHVKKNLFFTSNLGSTLWKTDGKKSGTLKLHTFGDFELPSISKYNFYSSWLNNELIFFERQNWNSGKMELWRSDGTVAGTFQLPVSDYTKALGVFNNKLYFTNNWQLWVSDGTEAGTIKMDDRNFFAANTLKDKFYLLREANGFEYYEIDKNNVLTYLNNVNDFSSDIYEYSGLYPIDDRYLLHIVSTPDLHHFYLTDGNKENIKKAFFIKNLGNGANLNPISLTNLNKKIYFTATDSLKGNELWIWDFECPDGYTIRDNITKDSTVVYGKNIWGQNTISNNKTVTYDAKNGITLQPGFEAQKGTVFKTRLIGCANTSTNTIEENKDSKNEPLVKINTSVTYPQLIDFLYYLPNKSLKEIYEQAERNKLAPITWDIVTEKDIYRLDLKIGSSILKGWLPKKN
ncbi:ELWxxDGT repeat protein [Emticicia fontis]